MKQFYCILILAILFSSCGQNESKPEKTTVPKTKNETVARTLNEKHSHRNSDTITNKQQITSKKKRLITSSTKEISKKKIAPKNSSKNKTVQSTKTPPIQYGSFIHFRKMLDETKNGTTLTQNQLNQYHRIPKDAIKMIKSITKISDNEIAIKWHSTWFVEKVSDAKFNNASLKLRFDKDKMYTSGKAIGIKYNKKIYNELIIIGSSAYIPSVKGFHWQIGK